MNEANKEYFNEESLENALMSIPPSTAEERTITVPMSFIKAFRLMNHKNKWMILIKHRIIDSKRTFNQRKRGKNK